MWKIATKLRDLLDKREQRRALLLLAMILTMGLLETTSVASVMPFIAVLLQPSLVESNKYLSSAYHWFGFESIDHFLLLLGLMAFMAVVGSSIFKGLTIWAVQRFTQMRQHSLSRRLLESYLHRPYPWFLGRHSADLGKTVLMETAQVVSGALMPTLQMVTQGVLIILLVTLLLVVDPMLAVTVGLILGGAYGLILWSAHGPLRRIGQDRLKANQERFSVCDDSLKGIKEIKILGKEHSFLERFENASLRCAKHQATNQIVNQVPQFALQAIAVGGILIIAEYQLLVHGSHDWTMPIIVLYALAAYRLLPAAQRFYQSAAALPFSVPTLEALHRDLMESTPDVSEERASLPKIRLKRGLELQNVSYRYPNSDKFALDAITMQVAVRSTVGLVGATGSGKTTLIDVILGLLEPQEGLVLLDDVPLSRVNRRSWQQSVGYVPQDIFLARDTLAANIAFGVPETDIDLQAVERAARLANLHQFAVDELDNGYATVIGERGLRLSGGQRQRVGIARALYSDPEILILDEATSALDNITEAAVIDAVNNLIHRKTVIMIAHRLTTVRHCDVIVMLREGKISAVGDFDTLIEKSKQFQVMVESARL